ncbi:MAM33 domain-containing protein [Cephalotus follicularis]|uniref:MAM33 domain-containing protein n=1 Tax=Cephalotus follicularis TaxID=3775 RepID=A0A1Q3D8R6_CEPFO|nr:MAM33 domain-containing protein [Cephalotus follicularis]
MAVNYLLRRASSTVLSLSIRAVGSPRTYHRAISTVLTKDSFCSQLNHQTFPPSVRYSTAVAEKRRAEEKLLRVIESEIECANKPNANILENKPEGFPFKIEDNAGERTIFLRREYGDEIIKVEVDLPILSISEEEEKKDEEEGSTVPLVVSISKGSGACLEFGITAYLEEIVIDSFSIKQSQDSADELAYGGPDFDDLDDKLREALREYLEVRGINCTTVKFLHQYMTNKDAKEYLVWLNNLKKYVEE